MGKEKMEIAAEFLSNYSSEFFNCLYCGKDEASALKFLHHTKNCPSRAHAPGDSQAPTDKMAKKWAEFRLGFNIWRKISNIAFEKDVKEEMECYCSDPNEEPDLTCSARRVCVYKNQAESILEAIKDSYKTYLTLRTQLNRQRDFSSIFKKKKQLKQLMKENEASDEPDKRKNYEELLNSTSYDISDALLTNFMEDVRSTVHSEEETYSQLLKVINLLKTNDLENLQKKDEVDIYEGGVSDKEMDDADSDRRMRLSVDWVNQSIRKMWRLSKDIDKHTVATLQAAENAIEDLNIDVLQVAFFNFQQRIRLANDIWTSAVMTMRKCQELYETEYYDLVQFGVQFDPTPVPEPFLSPSPPIFQLRHTVRPLVKLRFVLDKYYNYQFRDVDTIRECWREKIRKLKAGPPMNKEDKAGFNLFQGLLKQILAFLDEYNLRPYRSMGTKEKFDEVGSCNFETMLFQVGEVLHPEDSIITDEDNEEIEKWIAPEIREPTYSIVQLQNAQAAIKLTLKKKSRKRKRKAAATDSSEYDDVSGTNTPDDPISKARFPKIRRNAMPPTATGLLLQLAQRAKQNKELEEEKSANRKCKINYDEFEDDPMAYSLLADEPAREKTVVTGKAEDPSNISLFNGTPKNSPKRKFVSKNNSILVTIEHPEEVRQSIRNSSKNGSKSSNSYEVMESVGMGGIGQVVEDADKQAAIDKKTQEELDRLFAEELMREEIAASLARNRVHKYFGVMDHREFYGYPVEEKKHDLDKQHLKLLAKSKRFKRAEGDYLAGNCMVSHRKENAQNRTPEPIMDSGKEIVDVQVNETMKFILAMVADRHTDVMVDQPGEDVSASQSQENDN
ncbi:hypothetical protein GCK72_025459 [Caenorhabditis remanei]|uniref:Uncharacterized protein n=1 Tax=Caenorhabditis remanei TaxID=31234 RepID=A0A6A5G2S2_CAERE|nr:hypothetical protein GCK72_025459 [Caenorhabditis remanei]KAF1748992.1 hypothetical protein GCK72_025459 [Caenorhabditis remanei]